MPSCAVQKSGEISSAFWNAASDSLKRPAPRRASPSESCGLGSFGMMRTVLFERGNRTFRVTLPQGGISEHVLRATGVRIERSRLLQRGDGFRILLGVDQLLPEQVMGTPVAGRELREMHERGGCLGLVATPAGRRAFDQDALRLGQAARRRRRRLELLQAVRAGSGQAVIGVRKHKGTIELERLGEFSGGFRRPKVVEQLLTLLEVLDRFGRRGGDGDSGSTRSGRLCRRRGGRL